MKQQENALEEPRMEQGTEPPLLTRSLLVLRLNREEEEGRDAYQSCGGRATVPHKHPGDPSGRQPRITDTSGWVRTDRNGGQAAPPAPARRAAASAETRPTPELGFVF